MAKGNKKEAACKVFQDKSTLKKKRKGKAQGGKSAITKWQQENRTGTH